MRVKVFQNIEWIRGKEGPTGQHAQTSDISRFVHASWPLVYQNAYVYILHTCEDTSRAMASSCATTSGHNTVPAFKAVHHTWLCGNRKVRVRQSKPDPICMCCSCS